MTIHCEALEEQFPMVPFSIQPFLNFQNICMVESPVFVAEQFSWYISFGITINLSGSNLQGFYKEYKGYRSLFYNVPSFDMSLYVLFSITKFQNKLLTRTVFVAVARKPGNPTSSPGANFFSQ
jgi:hypothetical protein